MKKKTRIIMFLSMAVMFILFAPALVLYSQGYRFDLEAKKITQTGGFFLRAIPKKVNIFMEGKMIKQTDFFFGSVLIENLLPKKYGVEIKKQGFFTWKKSLEIKPKEVTEAKNILLFPEDPGFTFLTKGIDNPIIFPNERQIIWQEQQDGSWSLKSYDLDKGVKSHLISGIEAFPQKESEILKMQMPEDNGELLLEIKTNSGTEDFILDLNAMPPKLTEKNASSQAELVSDLTKNKSEEKETIEKPDNKLAVLQALGNSYYLNKEGFVLRESGFFTDEARVNDSPIPISEGAEYEMFNFSDFIFIQEKQGLFYVLDRDARNFRKIFDRTETVKISPDNEKILYYSDYEIGLFFLEESHEQPKREKGESIFLIRISDEIRNVYWLDSFHLIFNTAKGIKIIETDNRDNINIYQISEFEDSRIIWLESSEKFYVLSRGGLWISENILP